jgi:spore coat polysaccharide biosynthesis protein SpsF
MEKVVIIVQARLGSTRLHSKILKEVNGAPAFLLNRTPAPRKKRPRPFIIATTTNARDGAIVELCQKEKVAYMR